MCYNNGDITVFVVVGRKNLNFTKGELNLDGILSSPSQGSMQSKFSTRKERAVSQSVGGIEARRLEVSIVFLSGVLRTTSCEDKTRQDGVRKDGISLIPLSFRAETVFRKTQILRETTALIAFRSRHKSRGRPRTYFGRG